MSNLQNGQMVYDNLPPIPLTGGLDSVPSQQASQRIFARFFYQPVQQADGVWKDVEMLEKLIAGDTKSQPVRKVTDGMRREFAREYKLFKEAETQTPQGFPIRQWLGDNAAARNMEAKHVFTVEQLVSLSDSQLQSLGLGGREMRARAQAFLEIREKAAPSEKLAAENVALNNKIDLLTSQLGELSQQIDATKTAAASATSATDLTGIMARLQEMEAKLAAPAADGKGKK